MDFITEEIKLHTLIYSYSLLYDSCKYVTSYITHDLQAMYVENNFL